MRYPLTWYWIGWLILGFGVPEGFGLITGRYTWTLSETVWHIFSVDPHQTVWQWKFTHLVLALFMCWLTAHLAFRIWR